ncbi:hypothetical protein HDV01_005849 [Terramyces sp. JEL0728]|nr:hypothetical protein HDV01_005849 [Terramyces sp. JEL0728]
MKLNENSIYYTQPTPDPPIAIPIRINKEILQLIESGKAPEMSITVGGLQSTSLQVGNDTFGITVLSEKDRNECYLLNEEEKTLSLVGTISSKYAVKPSIGNTKVKQKQMRIEQDKEKQEKRVVLLDDVPVTKKGVSKPVQKKTSVRINRSNPLPKIPVETERTEVKKIIPKDNIPKPLEKKPTPTVQSPAITSNLNSPANNTPKASPVTKIPSAKQTTPDPALRKELLHYLAAKPRLISDCVEKMKSSESEILNVLNDIGKPQASDKRSFQLKTDCYKELRPWEYQGYTDKERSIAIRNAAMYIPKHEQIHLLQPGSSPSLKRTRSSEDVLVKNSEKLDKEIRKSASLVPSPVGKKISPIATDSVNSPLARSLEKLNSDLPAAKKVTLAEVKKELKKEKKPSPEKKESAEPEKLKREEKGKAEDTKKKDDSVKSYKRKTSAEDDHIAKKPRESEILKKSKSEGHSDISRKAEDARIKKKEISPPSSDDIARAKTKVYKPSSVVKSNIPSPNVSPNQLSPSAIGGRYSKKKRTGPSTARAPYGKPDLTIATQDWIKMDKKELELYVSWLKNRQIDLHSRMEKFHKVAIQLNSTTGPEKEKMEKIKTILFSARCKVDPNTFLCSVRKNADELKLINGELESFLRWVASIGGNVTF